MNTITTPVSPVLIPSALTLESISESIHKWNNTLCDVVAIEEKLQACQGFTIPPDLISSLTGEHLHVYIGLGSEPNELLEFFLIDAAKDNKETITNWDTNQRIIRKVAGIPYDAESFTSNLQLPVTEGDRRITNWHNNCGSWLADLYKCDKPPFQAWTIPKADLKHDDGDYTAYFGLFVDYQIFKSDLVIKNSDDIFTDLVRPVPPFKLGEMPDFYLLMYTLAND